MVRIKKVNLKTEYEIPYSTYKTRFKDRGWEIIVKKDNTKIEKVGKDGLLVTTTTGIDDEISLSSMSLSQLKEYAARNGIDISGGDTKREIRNIIEMSMADDI